jgi:hypothetical protein
MTGKQHPKILRNDSLQATHRYRYSWFAFYQGWLEDRNLKGHHLRDGAAFRELCVALDDRGGRYETTFRNGPATPAMRRHYEQIITKLVEANEQPLIEDVVEYQPVDESFLEKVKLLVVNTRIPMNDIQQGNKVTVQPGFTSLEQKVIRACRPYLEVCARSRVRLSEALAARLPNEFADRADIRFRAYDEPWYTELHTLNPSDRQRRPKPSGRRTAVYVLQLPSVPALKGTDLLVVWGQGGTQTLALAQRLRTDLSFVLDSYGLSMIEMVLPERAALLKGESRRMEPFRLLDAAQDWEAHVLLQGVLLDADGKTVPGRMPVRRGRPAPKPVKAPARVRPSPRSRHTGSGV